jgi:hypothetical protein
VIYSDLRATMPPGTRYDHNLQLGQHIPAGLVPEHLKRFPHAQVLWNRKVVGLA